MKLVIFLMIAAACIIGAVSNSTSTSASNHSAHSPSYLSSNSAYTQATYIDHIATGRSSIDQRHYRFKICKVNNEYRAYIENSPSYRSRATDGHSTHRHYDGRHYVCWSTPVRTYDNMVAIAKQWADCTQRYIETGTRF